LKFVVVWLQYCVDHIKSHKNVLADKISRVELPTSTLETVKNIEEMVADVNVISDTSLSYDLHDRLDHV